MCRRVHAPCQKSLRRASFGFDDLFGGYEGGDISLSMATDEVSPGALPLQYHLATEHYRMLLVKAVQSWILCMQTPSSSQPEYMATDNKSSLWTCTFCQSECGSFATVPVLEARLEITDEAGENTHSTQAFSRSLQALVHN